MSRHFVASVALLLASSLAGCGSRSGGELGRAQFAWDEGAFGCLFGCDAAEPMAARASAGLQVLNYKNLPAFTVASDDPSVLEFSHSAGSSLSSYVGAKSLKAGSARLIVNDAASGELIDRFLVEVHDVARIAADDGQYQQQLTIAVDGGKQLRIRLFDSDGAKLKGVGAVDYAFAGGLQPEQLTLVSALAQALGSVFGGTTTEYAQLTARSIGSGSLTVTAPSGAALTVPAAVVGESAITGLTLREPEVGKVGSYTDVQVQATVGAEPVWSPPSKWTIAPADGPIQISIGARDYASIKGTAAGSATVTCTLNGIAASKVVVFQ